ncbi:NAD-dependent epimerase/dehydratase family protein [Lentzea sp. BCCO 10_0856]|uniref:NAD-dependent epimerase/dehydratase family protein n=1 Tax=Lentzea miocenica TaxID=3095431 RepID=A0ABU4T6H4_9PSEU|nr:NAD-dependent epimerase/dehydratase family protein [Lentzea sp. BCCO 10_0856]MDX8033533.1 NAD-dependent epimerase/dehydratase family protein [Lentzea sp. BCCO 10_0856]
MTGATGVLGREALPLLRAAGHEVGVLDRHKTSLFDAEQLATALTGYDAVINLATRIPLSAKAVLASAWAENNRIRTEGSAALVEAARMAGVGRIVQEGISFVYADGGDRELDEDAPLKPVEHIASSVQAQQNVLAHPGGVFLRIGMLIGGAAQSPPVLVGDGWMSVVHPGDAAAAAVAVLDAPAGVYNVGSPVLKRDMGITRLPRFLGGFNALFEVFGRSQRVVSTKLTGATGWKPRADPR